MKSFFVFVALLSVALVAWHLMPSQTKQLISKASNIVVWRVLLALLVAIGLLFFAFNFNGKIL